MLKGNGEELLKNYAKDAYPPTITKVGDNIHHVLGYGHSNSTIIEADNSVILIDTFDTDIRAERLKKIVRRITDKPIKTIIYTHGHPDHRGGGAAFSDTVDEVIMFAPKRPVLGGTNELKDILNKRTSYQFGYELSNEDVITQGLGIREGFTVGEGKYSFIEATTIYNEDKVNRNIDGINIEMVSAVGETDDQIFVWLPDNRVLCCGDNYYGCWPNLYALRGGQYRDINAWINSLELILSYPAEYVFPGHTRALIGKDNIQEVLTNYKDAIKYVLTETLTGMNKGLSSDELASTIRLPEELSDLPYLGEFYGTVAWSVRSIYNGYLGWFDGNPTQLNKLPPKEYSEKMIKIIGGETKIVAEIKEALANQEAQWAIELCDLLIGIDRQSKLARQLKAKGLLVLSELETSANGRHYYIAYAKELLD